jgi:hypothetical protein
MKKTTRLITVAALLAAALTGCIIRTARPCRTECWWSHGRQICERRCY